MHVSKRHLIRSTRLLVCTVAIAAVSAVAPPSARAEVRDDRAAAQWAQRRSRTLTTVDPAASLTDLKHLRAAVGDAKIVGLGEAIHGAAETTRLNHRMLRLLVEDLGFRRAGTPSTAHSCG